MVADTLKRGVLMAGILGLVPLMVPGTLPETP